MAQLNVKTSATSIKTRIFIGDSSVGTGAGLTGLVFNTSSLVAYYHKEGSATATVITLVTATVGTYTSSGFKEVDATNMPGVYEIGIPNAALDTAGFTTIMLKGAANMVPTIIGVYVQADDPQVAKPTNFNLASIDSNGRLDIIKIAGTTQTARDIGASVLLSSGTGTGQLSLTSGQVTANNVPSNFTSMLINSSGYIYPIGQVVRENTAQAGAAGSITLDASASSTNDIYKSAMVTIWSATGIGQTRLITAYNGTTKVATISPNWQTNPDNTSKFVILPAALQDINQSFPTNFASLSIDASGRVDVIKIAGTTQTARDIGASVLLSSGTGTGQLSLSSGTVTVGTNNDKTGYTLSQSFPSNFASLAITAGGIVTANVTQFGGTNGTFASGIPAVNATQLGGTSQTGRDIGASVLLSPGTGTGQISLTSGAVTVGTNNDKTGYSLSQSFPSNFADLSISATSGRVDVAKIAGTAQTARDLGASVLLSPGTGTGQISLTSGAVTTGTNNDKTGYTLSTAGIDAVLTRNLSNIDSATAPCLGWAAAALTRGSDIGTPGPTSATLTIYKDDGTTPLYAKTLTLQSGINPIIAQTAGA